jgi:RNA polymerase-binding transcription factor DksA
MTKDKKYFIDLLQERITRLKEERTINEQRLAEVQEDQPISSDDIGSQRDDRDRFEQEISNTSELIEEAERALTWGEKNGFICAICRKPIECDRLEADPASVTCKEHRDQEDSVSLD